MHVDVATTERDGGPGRASTHQIWELLVGNRSPQTVRAYGEDLSDFSRFVARQPSEAIEHLLSTDPGSANAIVFQYRAALAARGLSPNTVNRRLAALRALVKLARTIGMITWKLEVPGLRADSYRDTRGPGVEGVRKVATVAHQRGDPKGLRDQAILRLLFDLGLRRAEVIGLDLEDLDVGNRSLMVLGKGRSAKERFTLPAPTIAAILAWTGVRGSFPGPLFTNFDRARKGRRLTGTSVYRIVKGLGAQVGVRARPHGIRHVAITAALDQGSSLRAVQRFSRHRDLRVLMVYDDNREDLGGRVAEGVADALDPMRE